MTPREKFLKMYYKLPQGAKDNLVYDFINHPMTLRVVKNEVLHRTELGKQILKRLGFEE